MKRLILFTLFFSIFISGFAQVKTNTLKSNFASVAEANNIIQKILDVVGLQASFEIKASNAVPNAAAVIANGKRYILYNPGFIAAIDRAAGTDWASIAILAHEIGHHLNGHTILGAGSTPAIELQADEFSGFALRKMGASVSQAQSAMQIAASSKESTTHPAKADRLVAIENGWIKANNQLTGRNDVAKTLPREKQKNSIATQPVYTNRSVLPDRYILYDVSFHNDKSNTYFVTTQNNVVTVKGNQLVVVGKLSKTGDRSFPLKIFDTSTVLYVSKTGSILTQRGKEVGTMRNHA